MACTVRALGIQASCHNQYPFLPYATVCGGCGQAATHNDRKRTTCKNRRRSSHTECVSATSEGREAHTIDRRPLHAECGSVSTTYNFEIASRLQKSFQSVATTTFTFEVAHTRCQVIIKQHLQLYAHLNPPPPIQSWGGHGHSACSLNSQL